ncbi:MAG: prephenate dehydrogenase/arogenate dehydrogenase family protein [bacterium]|nr:prephenate dehydrogenase/arogenate dehydrogenase family protein [bacterium]
MIPAGTRIAYLGPRGTHSEHALTAYAPDATREAVASIAEIFSVVAQDRATAGFVPIENKIEGPISATLDGLLRHSPELEIIDSFSYTVEHALGVLPESPANEKQECIEQVISHPQPLQQCSEYLLEKLPNAEHISSASTSAAAKMIAEQKLLKAAAIAPAKTLKAAGLNILANSIENIAGNQTRFVLFARCDSDLRQPRAPRQRYVTSVVVDPGKDRQGLLFEVLELVSVRHHINLLSIHSRPDGKGGFVFHLDLEGHIEDKAIRTCLKALEEYSLHSTGETVTIRVFGSYPLRQFYAQPFKSIGIIGGGGIMGQWFTRFFREAGIAVKLREKNATETIEAFLNTVDVVLLSVPMHAVKEVISEITPQLKPGQLIVENCSIKSTALDLLTSLAPQGVEVLGMHTMFGASATSLRGENVIFTRTGFSGEKSQAFADIFYKYGANVSHASAARHDKASAYLQSLLHLVMLSLAEIIQKDFPSIDELEKFSTPNFRGILASLKRIARQQPDLVADLQLQNEEATGVRHRFLEVFFRHTMALDRGEREHIIDAVSALQAVVKDDED